MKAIVVTNRGAGTAGMKLVERPMPRAAINDVVVQVHASGDPGVAIACWSAALRLSRPTDEWRELARCSAIRDPELCGAVDPCLCHGAAGLAHIYNRAYQACGDPVFLDAARAWFRRTLDMRRPEGLGGFASPSQVPDTWRTSTGLLDGATGVALALLAAVEPVEPRWDRLLLCDLPPDRNS